MGYQYIPIRMAKVQIIHHSICWQGCRTPGTLLVFGMQNCIAILEESLAVAYKGNSLTIWSSKCALRYLPIWSEKHVHTKTCT